jgi:hypothetical protein
MTDLPATCRATQCNYTFVNSQSVCWILVLSETNPEASGASRSVDPNMWKKERWTLAFAHTALLKNNEHILRINADRQHDGCPTDQRP